MTKPKHQAVRFKKKEPIPEFKTIAEEAEFWDTHDFADYWDDFKPVNVRFAKNLSQGITVRLEPDILNRVRVRAHKHGIGPTTLIRMWVMERLQRTDSSVPAYRSSTG